MVSQDPTHVFCQGRASKSGKFLPVKNRKWNKNPLIYHKGILCYDGEAMRPQKTYGESQKDLKFQTPDIQTLQEGTGVMWERHVRNQFS